MAISNQDKKENDDASLTLTYSLIYDFLTRRAHTKAAEAVKKAAKNVVVLQENSEQKPTLEDVVTKWKASEAKKEKESSDEDDSSSSSGSSSDSSNGSASDSDSDSDSSSSSSDSESESPAQKPKVSKVALASKSQETKAIIETKKVASPPSSKTLSSGDDDSDSDSSDSPSEDGEETKPGIGAKQGVQRKVEESSSDSSSESSSSDSESDSGELTTKKTVTKKSQQSHTKDSSSDSSSSDSDSSSESDELDSSDSDSDAKPSKETATPKPASPKPLATPTTAEDASRVVKKRRLSEGGTAAPSATVSTEHEESTIAGASSEANSKNGKEKGKAKPRKSNTPFQRVKPEMVHFHDERLKDNTFEARGATAGDYGEKAARDLIVTRGAGFRKEKNKKKRGSYRGGDISLEAFSIKFND